MIDVTWHLAMRVLESASPMILLSAYVAHLPDGRPTPLVKEVLTHKLGKKWRNDIHVFIDGVDGQFTEVSATKWLEKHL